MKQEHGRLKDMIEIETLGPIKEQVGCNGFKPSVTQDICCDMFAGEVDGGFLRVATAYSWVSISPSFP